MKKIFAALLALSILGSSVVATTIAQNPEKRFKKYKNKYDPDDEIIENAARKSAEYLSGFQGLPNATDYKGELCIVALTILEVSKRYDAKIPKEHPMIQRALDAILDTISKETGSQGLEKLHSIYYPALATILLCEVDDETYAPQINRMIRWFQERQTPNGGWGYYGQSATGDVSQSQYACLALFIAKHHKFKIDPEVGKRALEFLVAAQNQDATWHYHYNGNNVNQMAPKDRRSSLSLHTSALGSVYLLADLLQLTPRAKNMVGNKNFASLPPSVSVYVKPKPGQSPDDVKEGPLVSMNQGAVASRRSRGNGWLADNFTVNSNNWNYYYLYALERYAFFREQAEGEVKEVPDWYDQGCDFLLPLQDPQSGAITGRDQSPMDSHITTALATLFLVRSSQILIAPSNGGDLNGGIGFAENVKLKVDASGGLKSEAMVQGVEDVMSMLNNDSELQAEQLELIADSIGNSIDSTNSSMSKSQRLRFLTGLIKERDYYRRLLAVRLLAREQTMDNVPMLLYALSDPNFKIAREAHDGLRLISRRIEAYPLSDKPDKAEFMLLQKKWTEWFLKIRPGAKLIED